MLTEALHRVLSQVEAQLGPVGGEVSSAAGTAPGNRILADVARVGPVFIKASDGSPEADQAVAAEVALLMHLQHRNLPRVLAGDPSDDVPWMVQPQLTTDGFTPPWPSNLKRVWAAIDALSTLQPPPWLSAVGDVDPWLDPATRERAGDHASALAEASARVTLRGSDLVHGDLGGGNVHTAGRRVTIIDWSDAFVGNADLDRTSVAVDVAHTDGRRVLPPVDDPAAWLAKTVGLLLGAAARPAWTGPGGEQVRAAQADLAQTALTWTVELL